MWLVFTAVAAVLSTAPGSVPWTTPLEAACGIAGDARAQMVTGDNVRSETLLLHTPEWRLPANFTPIETELRIEASETLSVASMRWTNVFVGGVEFTAFRGLALPFGAFADVTATLPGAVIGENVTLQVERTNGLSVARVQCVELRVRGDFPVQTTAGVSTTGTTAGSNSSTGSSFGTSSSSSSSSGGTSSTSSTSSSSGASSTSSTSSSSSGASSPTSTLSSTTSSPPPLPPTAEEDDNASSSPSAPDPLVNTIIGLAFAVCFGACFACTAFAFFSRAGKVRVGNYRDVYGDLDGELTDSLMGHIDGKLVLVSARRPDVDNDERRRIMGIYHDNVLPVARFLDIDRVAYYLAPTDLRPWRLAHSQRVLEHFNTICGLATGLSYLHRNRIYHGQLTLDSVFLSSQGACLANWYTGLRGEHPWRDPAADPELPSEDADLWDLGWTVWQMFSDGRRPCASWEEQPEFVERARQRPDEFFQGIGELMPPDLMQLCKGQWDVTAGVRCVAGAFVIRVEIMAGFSGRGESEIKRDAEDEMY